MGPDEWVSVFLFRRGLKTADGRPLYAYRCDVSEFESLRAILRSLTEFAQTDRKIASNSGTLAAHGPFRRPAAVGSVLVRAALRQCFCLYCSEWWRRNHSGGHWSWEGAFESLGWKRPDEWLLYEWVSDGLRIWRRSVLRNRGFKRIFLVTLACEGGLPLELVKKERHRLRLYFERLLSESAQIDASAPTDALAAACADILPSSLRQEIVYELSARLVQGIWGIQKQIGEAGRIDDLDRLLPDWRESLPLDLSDETAMVLVKGLVKEAKTIASVRGVSGLRVDRRLVPSGERFFVEAELHVPRSLSGHRLASILGVPLDDLPLRCELWLRKGTEPDSALGYLTRLPGRDDPTYLLESQVRGGRIVRGAGALETFRVISTGLDPICEAVTLPGGGTVSDLPWVFAAQNREDDSESDAHREPVKNRILAFRGEGSTRVKSTDAFVAVPEGTLVEPCPSEVRSADGLYSTHCSQIAPSTDCGTGEPGSAVPEEGAFAAAVGRIDDSSRIVYRVRGRVEFLDPDGQRSVVETGQVTDDSTSYWLQGKALQLGTGGLPIYLGLPDLVEQDSKSGILHRYSALDWRAGSLREWRYGAAGCHGEIHVRFTREGFLRFRDRITVLPGEARILVLPGASAKSGEILISGTEAAGVELENGDGVDWHWAHEPRRDEIRISLMASGLPPPRVSLLLKWSDGQHASLSLPFPAQGGRFVGRNGTVIGQSERVALELIRGVKAIAFLPGSIRNFTSEHFAEATHTGCAVYLEGELNGRDIDAQLRRSLWIWRALSEVSPGWYELDLEKLIDAVRLLFRMTRDLDAALRLTIRADGAGMFHGDSIEIRRFDSDFQLLKEEGVARRVPARTADCTVQIQPLWDPTVDPNDLEPAGNNTWQLRASLRAAGPWLVSGWEGNHCSVRPICVPVLEGLETNVNPVTCGENQELGPTFGGVARLNTTSERERGFDQLFASMAGHWNHPRWEELFAYLQRFARMPATTLDLVDRIIESSEFAALLGLKAAEAGDGGRCVAEIWNLLDDMPFLWALVPVDSWVAATRALTQGCKELFEQSPIPWKTCAEGVLDAFSREAEQRLPAFGVIRELVEVDAMGRAPAETRYFKPVGREAMQATIRVLLEKESQELFVRHVGERWPFMGRSGELRHWADLNIPECSNLWQDPGTAFRSSVVDAPIISAALCIHGLHVPQYDVFHLRKLREFDPPWFDHAHGFALTLLLTARARTSEPPTQGD